MNENNTDLNRTHGEDLSDEYDIQKYNAFSSFEPPKTPEEMNEEFGAEPEPNFAAENYNGDLDNTALLDPNDMEPPIPFIGRTDDPNCMEAAYEEDQTAEEDDPTTDDITDEAVDTTDVVVEPMPTENSSTPTPDSKQEESNPEEPPKEETAVETTEEAALDKEQKEETTPKEPEATNPPPTTKEPPVEEPQKQEQGPVKEPPAANPTDTDTPSAQPATEGASKPDETPKEPNEAPKKKLLCPHCGKQLYLQIVGGMKIFRHQPEDAKNCDAMFDSVSEVKKAQITIEAKKAKLAKMVALQKQQELEKAKLIANAKNASNSNKSNYTSFISDADKKKEEEAAKEKKQEAVIDSDSLHILTLQIGQVISNQTALQTTLNTELVNIKSNQEKILTTYDNLTKGLTNMEEALKKIDVEGANTKLQEVGDTISSTLEELENIKPIPGILKGQMEKLERNVSDSLSATRNAGEQFDLYTRSVRNLQAANAKLNVMIPYCEKYLEETDQRYESMLERYGQKQKEFGLAFKKQTKDFFIEAEKKIYNQLNLSNGTAMPPMYGYFISFVLAFVLMIIYDFIR